MSNHIIKHEYKDEVKLPKHLQVYWCGVSGNNNAIDFTFADAQHALLAIEDGSLIQPCEKCLREMKRVIKSRL